MRRAARHSKEVKDGNWIRDLERRAIDQCKATTTSVNSWRVKEFIAGRSKAVKNGCWCVRRKPGFSQS